MLQKVLITDIQWHTIDTLQEDEMKNCYNGNNLIYCVSGRSLQQYIYNRKEKGKKNKHLGSSG